MDKRRITHAASGALQPHLHVHHVFGRIRSTCIGFRAVQAPHDRPNPLLYDTVQFIPHAKPPLVDMNSKNASGVSFPDSPLQVIPDAEPGPPCTFTLAYQGLLPWVVNLRPSCRVGHWMMRQLTGHLPSPVSPKSKSPERHSGHSSSTMASMHLSPRPTPRSSKQA
jgi:hypothetical protein